jgi:serine protease Do
LRINSLCEVTGSELVVRGGVVPEREVMPMPAGFASDVEGSGACIVRSESSMTEKTTPMRARTALRVAASACVIALVAAAGATAGRTMMPHDWRTSLHARAGLIGIGSGPASFADIVDTVKPAVVGVQTKLAPNSDERNAPSSPMDRLRPFGTPQIPPSPGARRPGRVVTAQGSGFFISADGYAVTNNHVVEGSTTAEIQTDNQQTYTAKVVGTDPTSDLALLKVDGRTDFPYVKLSDKMPRVGDWVLAVGNPFGLGGSVTAGIVSARERNIGGISSDNLIQIDAPINKGDSGGPTFDLDGKVIGVNMMIFSPSGGSIGIAFAIPAETVRAVVPQLKEKGAVTRGWLGVQVQTMTPEIADALGLQHTQGALVAEAQADAPAAKAGITAGDVIASVNAKPIKTASELSRAVSASAPGSSVTLGVLRQGEEKSIPVALGQLPDGPQSTPERKEPDDHATTGRGDEPELGLKLAPAATIPGAGEQGVIITGIDPTGVAAEQGLELGDVIMEVSGKSVMMPDQIQSALNTARSEGKQSILMRLKSGDAMRFVAVPTG